MGLFNFKKKKKDLPLPSKPSGEKKAPGSTDFNEFLDSAPHPPGKLKEFKPGPTPPPADEVFKRAGPELSLGKTVPVKKDAGTLPPTMPKLIEEGRPVSKEPPVFKPVQPISKGSQRPATEPKIEPEVEEGFELPDFDEGDVNDLKELKALKKELEAKQSPVEKHSSVEPAELPKPKKPVPSEWETFPEPKEFFPPKEALPPKEFLPPKKTPEPGNNFTDIRKYIHIKENLDKIKSMAAGFLRLLNQHTQTGKSKEEIYQTLITDLNVIQEKLIVIDQRLFENT